MSVQRVLDVLKRLYGLGQGPNGAIDQHADDALVAESLARGVPLEKAVADNQKAVLPCKDANEWRACFVDSLLRNDKLSAKKFLLSLTQELAGEEPAPKARRR